MPIDAITVNIKIGNSNLEWAKKNNFLFFLKGDKIFFEITECLVF